MYFCLGNYCKAMTRTRKWQRKATRQNFLQAERGTTRGYRDFGIQPKTWSFKKTQLLCGFCLALYREREINVCSSVALLTSPCLRIEDWWRGGSQPALDTGEPELRRPVMCPLSDVMVVTGGDGPGLRSNADPCNPLLIPDTGSILRVNTLSYTFCII